VIAIAFEVDGGGRQSQSPRVIRGIPITSVSRTCHLYQVPANGISLAQLRLNEEHAIGNVRTMERADPICGLVIPVSFAATML
jgi:hypothetical protein